MIHLAFVLGVANALDPHFSRVSCEFKMALFVGIETKDAAASLEVGT